LDTTGTDAHRIETALMPILGYVGLKRELAQLADTLGNRERYESAGATMPHGLMIVGEPGLGKTLMARCLINASGLPHASYRHTHDGQKTADAIRATFKEARAKAPSIVLLDDLDKYSNSDYELRDTEEFIAVQECIDAVRDCGVFVLATVNDKDKLPRYTDALHGMAIIYKILGDVEKAEETYDRMIYCIKHEWGYADGDAAVTEVENEKALLKK
jgi:SpoVK/Ycf46/Vps4 family AAA+-type ATPase